MDHMRLYCLSNIDTLIKEMLQYREDLELSNVFLTEVTQGLDLGALSKHFIQSVNDFFLYVNFD